MSARPAAGAAGLAPAAACGRRPCGLSSGALSREHVNRKHTAWRGRGGYQGLKFPIGYEFEKGIKNPRTPGERPGGESRGIFHFKQGGRAGPLCFFLSMYSPRAHPGPPSPMDSEILIKPLSLWPEYSTGDGLDSVGTWHNWGRSKLGVLKFFSKTS